MRSSTASSRSCDTSQPEHIRGVHATHNLSVLVDAVVALLA